MKIEIRGNDSIKISGYVNATERDSRLIRETRGQFVEQVKSGVMQKALDNARDVKILLNHNWDNELGSIKSGTLSLKEDNIGLFAEAEITDPTIIVKAKNNELRGWSFGFQSKKDSWGVTDNPSVARRFLEDINISEVSIIDSKMLPFYAGTSIEARAESEEELIEIRSFESEIETITDDVEVEKTKDEMVDEQNKIDYQLENRSRQLQILKIKGVRY